MTAYSPFEIDRPESVGGRTDQSERRTINGFHEIPEREKWWVTELADLKLLQDVGAEIMGSDDSQSLYDKIMDAAVSIMRSDFASMQMLYPERGQNGELRLLASRGYDLAAAKFWEWVRTNSGCTCGVAMRTGQRAIAEDVQTCEFMVGTPDQANALRMGMLAMQSTPLIARDGKLVGMLSTHWKQPHTPSERDLRLLDALARQAADLIERKRAEQALRASEERYRQLTAIVTDVPWTTDADGQFITPQDAYSRYTGKTWDELRGLGWVQCIHPDDREQLTRIWNQAVASRSNYLAPCREWHGPTQQWRHVVARGTPVLNADGSVREWVGSLTDVHEQKLAEQALRTSEEKYRTLFESMDEGYCVIEFFDGPHGPLSDYIHVEANPAYTVNAGIPNIVGQKVREMVPDEADGWVEIYRNVLITGEPVRFERELVATGRYLELSAFRIEPAERKQVAVLFKDITARKQVEQTLRDSEERFRNLADTLPALIWVSDVTKACTWFNKGWLDFSGRPMHDLVGDGWAQDVHPDDLDRCLGIYNAQFDAREPFTMEYRLKRHDGQYRWIVDYGIPHFGAGGVFAGYVGSCIDITERKQAEVAIHRQGEVLEAALVQRTEEVKRAERNLATSQRMAAVGTLASGLAHDMANVLLPLGSRLDLLVSHASVDGATHDHLIALQGLVAHLRDMARNLSLFSRDPDKEGIVGETDLTEWCDRAWRFIEKSIRVQGAASIDLLCEIPKDGIERGGNVSEAKVPIAPHRLTQVVQNLIHNSRDAIMERRALPGGGDSNYRGKIALTVSRSGEDQISLTVSDDGIGMDEETKRRCTEPFFTTRNRPDALGGSGSGMGLALVESLIERCGGTLEIESSRQPPKQGTTITITFPSKSTVNENKQGG